mgnify:CR=1 FL=1
MSHYHLLSNAKLYKLYSHCQVPKSVPGTQRAPGGQKGGLTYRLSSYGFAARIKIKFQIPSTKSQTNPKSQILNFNLQTSIPTSSINLLHSLYLSIFISRFTKFPFFTLLYPFSPFFTLSCHPFSLPFQSPYFPLTFSSSF